MAYNANGDLYKREIVSELQEQGYEVNSVQKLNRVLEDMGVQEHVGNDWLPTEEGVDYTGYNTRVYNPVAWHPEIVNDVANYLDSQ